MVFCKCSWGDQEMTSGWLTVPIFLIFQNSTPLVRTEKPTHRKCNQYGSVILCGSLPLALIELELAFGMVFT